MRDNFTNKTKQELAKRVAFKCSFPNCNVVTIGPSSKNNKDSINLGEAAHIFAASEKGPRYNPEMASEERKSIENGIWMCGHHATLIDRDFIEYSAATIKQWKQKAEQATYKNLQEPFINPSNKTSTLISLGPKILFNGSWKSVKNNKWVFSVDDFIIGDLEKLKEFSIEEAKNSLDNYIIIESQGDGRRLNGVFGWEYSNGELLIKINVKKKLPRENPNKLGGDISFENESMEIVSGMDNAKIILKNVLNFNFGDLKWEPSIGTRFSFYYKNFQSNKTLLNKLFSIEIIRLISIPPVGLNNSEPTLNFINRLIKCEILNLELNEQNGLILNIKLEWGNGELWENDFEVIIN